MIDKLWFGQSPLRYLCWPLLWPLSLLFGCIARRRRRAYQNGKKSSYRPPLPVVVVGNISAGGNGKTPVVIALVEMLLKNGYQPGVVSRGYGGKAPAYPLLLDSTTPATHSGDEPRLIYRRTQVPVAVDPVRSQAVKALLDKSVDIIITDDGLQHYSLERDIEIVVVDGERRYGNGQLIPLGPLREPQSRLDEVDFVINNGGHAEAKEIAMSLAPSLAVNLVTGEMADVTSLPELVAFAGIGHPVRFFKSLRELGADVVECKGFADHQAFDKEALFALSRRGKHVIMTEKDAVKCDTFAQDNWWYLPVSAHFSVADEQRILDKIKEVWEKYGSPST